MIWSKYRNSCHTGIPAKNSCKSKKNRDFFDPLQNHVPVKNPPENAGKKEILRNPGRNIFLSKK
jgi:hypothetical protein